MVEGYNVKEVSVATFHSYIYRKCIRDGPPEFLPPIPQTNKNERKKKEERQTDIIEREKPGTIPAHLHGFNFDV